MPRAYEHKVTKTILCIVIAMVAGLALMLSGYPVIVFLIPIFLALLQSYLLWELKKKRAADKLYFTIGVCTRRAFSGNGLVRTGKRVANGYAEFSFTCTDPYTRDEFVLDLDRQPNTRFREGGVYQFMFDTTLNRRAEDGLSTANLLEAVSIPYQPGTAGSSGTDESPRGEDKKS